MNSFIKRSPCRYAIIPLIVLILIIVIISIILFWIGQALYWKMALFIIGTCVLTIVALIGLGLMNKKKQVKFNVYFSFFILDLWLR